ncbi:hypothetical protein [Aquabacterium sp.]|uniref:hypothetical protein n=1 Tax=Aquabacterium sp. TaxID=1872578 RepID=UPI002D19E6CC|nr:hypothetical protein [Aquabacterium sp.]HSW08691.1 hypothetical protein [Aquabacterium sp.]
MKTRKHHPRPGAVLVGFGLYAMTAAAMAQASFDIPSQVLRVPTIDVGGQTYRNLEARLDPDGRLTILSLTGPQVVDNAARISAATATAQSSSNTCSGVRPFYWEIGDKTQRLAGGSVNASGSSTVYDAGTTIEIASASKWLYGAYVAEVRGGALTAEDIRFLNFRSGYTNFGFLGCDQTDTVASCVARNNNGVLSPENIDRFYYSGGHMEKHASLPAPGMNLGPLANGALGAEIRRVLGTDINLSYSQPQLAGGARTSARDYATFLRKLLNQQLKMAALLGSYPVCTNPKTCPTAASAPTPSDLSWHYSIAHWVEDDPVSGDSAYSSLGAFGFYPWIDATKTWYGVVSRASLIGAADSANCGALVRKAWVTGVVQ